MEARFGHPVLLAETFVNPSRFRGACYLAAGWMSAGATRRVLAGIRRDGRERGRGQARGISWRGADRIADVAVNSGRGVALFLGAPTVRRLTAWIECAGIVDGPLFRQVREGGRVAADGLSAHSMRAIITRCAGDAGIKNGVRGHSLRVGSAQSLARAGAGLVEMQTVGRWKSPGMPARYARAEAEIAACSAIARYRYRIQPLAAQGLESIT